MDFFPVVAELGRVFFETSFHLEQQATNSTYHSRPAVAQYCRTFWGNFTGLMPRFGWLARVPSTNTTKGPTLIGALHTWRGYVVLTKTAVHAHVVTSLL